MKQRSHFLCAGLALGFALAAPSVLLAQSPAAETLQQKVGLPQETSPPAPATTSDAELGEIGVVQKFPKPEPLYYFVLNNYRDTADNIPRRLTIFFR